MFKFDKNGQNMDTVMGVVDVDGNDNVDDADNVDDDDDDMVDQDNNDDAVDDVSVDYSRGSSSNISCVI